MNDRCKTCPGCSRACTAGHPRCSYGRKFFAALNKDSLCRLFLRLSKRVKKQLKREKIRPEEVFAALSPNEQQELARMLEKLLEKKKKRAEAA